MRARICIACSCVLGDDSTPGQGIRDMMLPEAGQDKHEAVDRRNHPKMDETQRFMYLRHSNWTSCSLYWGAHFLLPQRGENGKKGITPKWMRHRGFCTLGIQTGPFAACVADFVQQFFQLPHLYTGKPVSYYPREGKMRKRKSPQNG